MQVINLDLSVKLDIPFLQAKQGDVGRKFQAVITDGGTAYNIPSGTTLSVWYSGTSGEGNYSEIGLDDDFLRSRSAFTISGNAVTVEMVAQMLSCPGRGTMCLVMNSAEGEQIATWDILYDVEKLPGANSEGAKQYYTAYAQAAVREMSSALVHALEDAKQSGEFDGPRGIQGDKGEPGHTPERGVDYWTEADKEEITSEVLFQVKPEFANNIKECTDTTKMYVLPDGYLYAYMMTETEGGPAFTNHASPTSADWQEGYRYRDDGVLAAATSANSFVSNFIKCKQGDIIRIKGVKDAMPIDTAIGAHTWMKVKPYDAGGNELGSTKAAYYLTQPYSVAFGKSLEQAVSVSDDDVYSYEIFWVSVTSSSVSQAEFSADVAQIRVSGVYAGSASDVIITVNEEIVYTEPTIGYQWANTGHAFVSSDYEDRIVALEQESDAASAEISDLHGRVNYSVGEIYGLKQQVNSGARWFALGDSITQGYASIANGDGTYSSGVTASANRWVNIVAEMNGYELTNYGIGGTGYLQGEKNARVLVDTIDFSQCDFVTLAYGVNDWKNKVNIGSMDDNIASGGSMVANMRYVIKKILEKNPYCKIFVITPINCRSLGSYTTNWGINYNGKHANYLGLEDIFQRQKEVCEYHGIELIDMTHSSIINRENIGTILADYVHPTVEGHKMMARELAQKITLR